MSLASIQVIKEVIKHPNADKLDIVKVLNYDCIVNRDQWKIGDLCVFIEPDSVLPDADWSKFYKSKSGRVKAIKLRSFWSFGIVESFKNVGIDINECPEYMEGFDITDLLKITKYEPPAPQELNAKGSLPFGIPKTDESRWQGLRDVPYGEIVDIFQKIDGQSASYYCVLKDGEVFKGILGRTLEYKQDCDNNYTKIEKKYNILAKLEKFCVENKVSLCLRGECHGSNVQKFEINPHTGGELSWAMFSVYLIDNKEYAKKENQFYFIKVAEALELPIVPLLEKDVILTKEVIEKYDEKLETINGEYFEGVVVQTKNISFKIISKIYDSKK